MSQITGPDIDAVVAHLQRSILTEVPSVFGKLVYLATLRDDNSGTYRHFALEARHPLEKCHAALFYCHREVFYAWLRTALEGQREDLLLYLSTLAEDRVTVLTTWSRIEPFRLYPPADIASSERDLFLSDLRILVALLLRDAPRA